MHIDILGLHSILSININTYLTKQITNTNKLSTVNLIILLYKSVMWDHQPSLDMK